MLAELGAQLADRVLPKKSSLRTREVVGACAELFQSKAALDTRLAAREASRCVPAHVDDSVRRHWPPMPVMAAVIDVQGRAPRNGTPWTIDLIAELLAKVHMHVEAGEWKSARHVVVGDKTPKAVARQLEKLHEEFGKAKHAAVCEQTLMRFLRDE